MSGSTRGVPVGTAVTAGEVSQHNVVSGRHSVLANGQRKANARVGSDIPLPQRPQSKTLCFTPGGVMPRLEDV